MESILLVGSGSAAIKVFTATTYYANSSWVFDIPAIGFVPDFLILHNLRSGIPENEPYAECIDYVLNCAMNKAITHFDPNNIPSHLQHCDKNYISTNICTISYYWVFGGNYYGENAPIEIIAIKGVQR